MAANRDLTGSRIPDTPARSMRLISGRNECNAIGEYMPVDASCKQELHVARLYGGGSLP